jgi:hypothetical protein
MLNDPERRRRIREKVELVRKHADDWRGDPSDSFNQAKTIPEVLALLIAFARAEGRDEVEETEVLLRLVDLSRAELLDIETTMAPLGYGAVAGVLRRLARTAKPRPPTERMGPRRWR